MPTKTRLLELFYYDHDTGTLINRTNRRVAKVGKPAGGHDVHGYAVCKIDGRFYKAHRIIYTMHYGTIPPTLVIDHIDRNKLNNKIDNLRAVTVHQNIRNSRAWQSYCPNCNCHHCAALKGVPLAA